MLECVSSSSNEIVIRTVTEKEVFLPFLFTMLFECVFLHFPNEIVIRTVIENEPQFCLGVLLPFFNEIVTRTVHRK